MIQVLWERGLKLPFSGKESEGVMELTVNGTEIMIKDDITLKELLKEIAEIKRRNNPVWGV